MLVHGQGVLKCKSLFNKGPLLKSDLQILKSELFCHLLNDKKVRIF